MYLGFFSFKILKTSKIKVPLASSNPFCFPPLENAWHGGEKKQKS